MMYAKYMLYISVLIQGWVQHMLNFHHSAAGQDLTLAFSTRG